MRVKFSRADFLEALFGPYYEQTGNFIQVAVADDQTDRASVSYYPSIQTLSAAHFPKKRHVFFGVCPRERMKPEKENIRYMTALWAGIDLGPEGYSWSKNHFRDEEAAMSTVATLVLPPSIVVRSGRGLHLYWLLKEVKEIASIEVAEDLLKKINDFLKYEMPVEIDSVLRLPDTWNPKYPAPKLCYVEHLDPACRYSGTDINAVAQGIVSIAGKITLTGPRLQPVEEQAGNSEEKISGAPEDGGNRPVRLRAAVVREVEPRQDEYEIVEDEVRGSLKGFSDEVLDELVDRIVDKLVHRFLNGFSEKIGQNVVDQVLNELVRRLTTPPGK